MIIPRRWIPSRGAYETAFKTRIRDAFRDSYPVTMPRVMGLFEHQTPAKRRQAAYKSSASRMGKAFAAKLFQVSP